MRTSQPTKLPRKQTQSEKKLTGSVELPELSSDDSSDVRMRLERVEREERVSPPSQRVEVEVRSHLLLEGLSL